jgi:hypothetical protein
VGAPVLKAIADSIASMDIKASPQEFPKKATIKNGTTFNVENLLEIADSLELEKKELQNIDSKFVKKTSKGWKSNNVYDANKVPNLLNMVLKDVLALLMGKNIKFNLKGNLYGKVFAQSLNPGTIIPMDAVLNIEMK